MKPKHYWIGGIFGFICLMATCHDEKKAQAARAEIRAREMRALVESMPRIVLTPAERIEQLEDELRAERESEAPTEAPEPNWR